MAEKYTSQLWSVLPAEHGEIGCRRSRNAWYLSPPPPSPFPLSSLFQSLSPEARLLLLTVSEPSDDVSLRAALDAGIGWQRLCALARHERAAPIVLRALRRLGPEPGDPGFDE